MPVAISKLLILSIFVCGTFSQGEVPLPFEMVKVPSGQLNQFWVTPISKEKIAEEKNAKIEKRAKPNTTKLGQSLKNVKGFEMMNHLVTEEMFIKFLEKNPSWQRDKVSSIYADKAYLSQEATIGSHPQSPVTNVSWFAAQAYCKHYGLRLPTVDEWEYAAAASEKMADANKEEGFLRRILDWYGEPRSKALKPVKSIYKNLYGLWDMHGLAWEWVYDFNSIFITGESREDSTFNKDLFCGAGAMSGADKENYAAFMRFAFRSSLKGNSSAWNLGFRCVR